MFGNPSPETAGSEYPGHSRSAARVTLFWLRVRLVIVVLMPAAVIGCGGQRGADTDGTVSGSEVDDGVRFTNATDDAGLAGFSHVTGALGDKWFPETVGGGVGVLDYDGDDWEDIVLIGGGTWPGSQAPPVRALWLYKNNGNGTFTDVTAQTGLSEMRAIGQGVSVADYDNDGDQDIFVTTLDHNLLLRNDDGVFLDVSKGSGLEVARHWSTSAIFFDADMDGHLDLYVGNYVDWSPENDIRCTIDGEAKAYCTPQLYTGIPGNYYHNNGDGTFTDWTERAGFATSPGKTLGVAEWDFNGDGWSDLVVANDTQRDLLYMNDGDGTFTEQGVASGIAFDENGRSRAGMGIDIGVLDDSGQPSIVVGHFTNEMIGVYRQIGERLFMDRAAQSQIGRPSIPTLTFGLLLTDADLDGDLDVVAANGHIDEDAERVQEGVSYRQPPQLFVNEGDGRFSDYGPPVDLRIVARGLATVDYDRDGDEDLIVTENGGPAFLIRNDNTAGVRLRVDLAGRDGNLDALGADVTALVGERRLRRRVRTGSSYLSSSDKGITFGLGQASSVDTLTIFWPGGREEKLVDLPAGFAFRVAEGLGVQEKIALRKTSPAEL